MMSEDHGPPPGYVRICVNCSLYLVPQGRATGRYIMTITRGRIPFDHDLYLEQDDVDAKLGDDAFVLRDGMVFYSAPRKIL